MTYQRGSKGTGMDKFQSDVQFVKKKDGSVVPNKDLRSDFDGKQTNFGNLDFQGKEFTKKEYRNQRWAGKKQFSTKQYAGNTDASKFHHSPHFVQQQAKIQNQYVRDGEKQYGVESIAREGASEETKESLQYSEDSETNIRRKVYKQPLIMSKDEYSDMTVEQTKSMLGR